MQPVGTSDNLITFIFVPFGVSSFTFVRHLFASVLNIYNPDFLFGLLTFMNCLCTHNVICLFHWHFF
jgi:hypothetical protein